MTRPGLLFDLDNTLLLEDAVTFRAVRTASLGARGRADADELYAAVLRIADARWRAAPSFAYADAMGLWWGEGLWGEFRGAGDELRGVREYAPRFRHEVWHDALASCGVDDDGLADELSERYRTARRGGEIVDPLASAALDDLQCDHRLALVTNGAPDVQREKISRTTLARHFSAVIISAEVGFGKPDPRIFQVALAAIGADTGTAVMIGDSLSRDVAGAHRAGLRAIWIDRDQARPGIDEPVPDARVSALNELRSVLAGLAPGGASPRGSP